jgi:muconate cycloisomerase
LKISRIETIPVNVPVSPDRAIVGSRGGHLTSPFLLIKVHTDEGIVGLGEVSCTPVWSGEDQVTAAHLIGTYLEPALIGKDPTEIARLSATMLRAVANNPFTRAGIEMALWDVLGKVAGLPLFRLWGEAQRDAVPTKFSVSGLDPSRAASIASWAAEQGFRAMKVKVGFDLESDLGRVAAVRRAVGPDIKLGIDANGGWQPWTAIEAIRRLAEFNVSFVEQPIAPGDVARMADVRAAAGVPIVADESVSTPLDALSLIRANAADVLSIYVGKGGGLQSARDIGRLAAAAGVGCTVGSNGELGIASAAMIHLGLVLPRDTVESLPCDILSPFMYDDLLLTQPLPIQAGVATAPAGPGLGVELDLDRVRHYQVDL